ncbi:gamma-secretase subunit PEN-2-like [Watersipora subatra]|uniref:gamma-secretase subunit PEN-2-like n=1 Tax=Watersipora subatra TaxID=2589382 RepID=UPI00355C7045
MDLSRASNEEKLNICRKYYLAGFAFLPFLWAVNAVWFFKYAFKTTEFPQQKKIRSYVIQSFVGSLIWLIALIIWISLYQLNRVSWGIIGDQISFIMPINKV